LDDAEHSAHARGIAVIKKTVLSAAVIGVSAVLTSSAVAQANPATPMSRTPDMAQEWIARTTTHLRRFRLG
jgi:hypothetical protein